MVLDRSTFVPGDDDENFHFDFLNITGGAPDDTWTSTDYTTLETMLLAFWNAMLSFNTPFLKLREIRWYRHGPGVTPPNPAERVLTLPTPVAGTNVGPFQAAQMSTTVTFRTGVRTSWGRTYLPFQKALTNNSLRPNPADVDAIATAANTLVTAAASADFRLVVTSVAKSAALNVEKIEVDDVLDVVRRRRLKHTAYRKILP